MLVGPPITPVLPRSPRKADGLDGIYRYLRDLDTALQTMLSSVVSRTIGLVGVRGFGSSGVMAQNFTKVGLAVGNVTTAMWVFTNMEADASYLILYSPNSAASFLLTGMTKATTNVLFSLGVTGASGLSLDVMLLR